MDYSFDLRNIGHFYLEYARLMEHWRKVPALKLLEVSYEDLILNTEQTARKTLDFLGLEWDERCLAPSHQPVRGGNRQPVAGAPAHLPPCLDAGGIMKSILRR